MSTWTALHAKVHQTLRQKQLLKKSDRILIALSGGQDSLCLGKLLLDLQEKWQWQLAIAHCDHCWSYDLGMANWVENIAINWNLPFYLETASTAMAETEAAARAWRYEVLLKIAREHNYKYIVTGHTMSDRAETLLYNLIRGAGADGLQALNWQRFLTQEIQLIRPLLNITRSETLDFCQQHQLPIWQDAANNNLKYARNRIRNVLIPYVQNNFNPQVETALAQTAELLAAELEYWQEETQKHLDKALSTQEKSLNRLYLRTLPLALQRRVIRQFLAEITPKALSFEQIESMARLINAPNGSRTSSLFADVVAEVQGEKIVLSEKSISSKDGFFLKPMEETYL